MDLFRNKLSKTNYLSNVECSKSSMHLKQNAFGPLYHPVAQHVSLQNKANLGSTFPAQTSPDMTYEETPSGLLEGKRLYPFYSRFNSFLDEMKRQTHLEQSETVETKNKINLTYKINKKDFFDEMDNQPIFMIDGFGNDFGSKYFSQKKNPDQKNEQNKPIKFGVHKNVSFNNRFAKRHNPQNDFGRSIQTPNYAQRQELFNQPFLTKRKSFQIKMNIEEDWNYPFLQGNLNSNAMPYIPQLHFPVQNSSLNFSYVQHAPFQRISKYFPRVDIQNHHFDQSQSSNFCQNQTRKTCPSYIPKPNQNTKSYPNWASKSGDLISNTDLTDLKEDNFKNEECMKLMADELKKQVGTIKMQTQKFDQSEMKKDMEDQYQQVQFPKQQMSSDIVPTQQGKLFLKEKKKEFLIQCGKCECLVAKIDTSNHNYLVSTQGSKDIFANFELANVTSLNCKNEAYPLENLKNILIRMLLRQEISFNLLDLNIFEIKLLHAVLVKRFKNFYTNSKLKLKIESPKKNKFQQYGKETFTDFLEQKRLQTGANRGLFQDIINQKKITFSEENLSEIDLEQISSSYLNILIENEPLKRLEEQLKFVLSRAEQSLIIDFLRHKKKFTAEQIDRNLKTNRYSIEVDFYKEFFEAVAKKQEIPIEKFYFPRNKNKLVSNSHKTINKSYMSNITSNASYVRQMKLHIKDHLLQAEKKTIQTKINNKIEKWNSFLLRKLSFEKENNILQHFDDFIQVNILDNDKFKLPWSIKQIDLAIHTVLDQLK